MSVREARQKYYEDNGIASDGGASEWFGRADFGPLTIYVPNFAARVAALERHDLHHIILNADTSMRGESIVGGFEVGAGCGRYWVPWFLEPQTLVSGLLLNPRETFRSFVLGRRSKNFYRGKFDPKWLELSVSELRDLVVSREKHEASLSDFALFVFWVLVGVIALGISVCLLVLPLVLIWFLFR